MAPEKARELLDAATPGPWRWENTRDVILRGNGQLVMTFARMGMNGAQPVMLRSRDGVYEKTGRENLNEFCNARLIAAAPDITRAYIEAAAREQRVRKLHKPVRIETTVQGLDWFTACATCRESDGVSMDYPCPTIRALDGDA